jgi:hypothetical protein
MNRTVLLAALLAVFPLASNAQTQCGPLEQAEATLRNDFGENPLIEWDLQLAEGAPNRTARVYANTRSGTLTILIVFEQNGRSIACLAGSGQNMRIAPQFRVQDNPL